MTNAGYYRFPTLHRDTVVFVCEDDLWVTPAAGGTARRLTSNPGQIAMPALSPTGEWVAFTGRDEGHPEVYVMPAAGGPARRLTFLGAETRVVGWAPDGEAVIFASDVGQPFRRFSFLYTVARQGGEPQRLPTGPAMSISYGPTGGMVIGRHVTDLARWKRYRGGLTGDLWIDPAGQGEWRRLLQVQGNVALPLWVGERIYFVSDHEGIGNLYSCLPSGEDVRRHTHHGDYYVRYPATDGQRIVYQAGSELYLFDPALNQTQLIPIVFHSSRAQRNRKFVDAADYLQEYSIHPNGWAVAITTRGKPFVMALWEGAVIQYGQLNGVRFRMASWLADGERLVVVSDATGEDALEIYKADSADTPEARLDGLDIGRPLYLATSPHKNLVALANHRNELIVVDLDERTLRVVDRSHHRPIRGVAWSPDGRWLAYGFSDTQQTSIIKLTLLETGETWPATRPILRDVSPAFDPEGRYLYFLSYREFDPVYDNLHLDLNFTWGMKPYLITLQAGLPSPFTPLPRAPGEKTEHPTAPEPPPAPPTDGETAPAGSTPAETPTPSSDAAPAVKPEKEEPPRVQIDLVGITERVIALPVPIGRYSQVLGIKGKILFSSFPAEGELSSDAGYTTAPAAKGRLEAYDLEEQRVDVIVEGITDFEISHDGKTLIYQAGSRLRVLKAGEKPDANSGAASRRSGWLDLDRIRLSVEPQAEWEQMYREAWRLQRDHFWTEDMSGVDWRAVYARYLPLLQRVATRSEFSDLMWEMQGELGTSHAYEYGGDYPPQPSYAQGFLGADFRYDDATDSYELTHIVNGDVWDHDNSAPLQRLGINLKVGDRLIAINGRKVGRDKPLGEMLVHQAGNEVFVTFACQGAEAPTMFPVKTLRSEFPARYREWVETNRRRVHEASEGRVGYVHIPDMQARGYAEFHRGYLAEVDRAGLIVDVRFNGGGHVSQLILEKLARRRLGYDVSRWGAPVPYPIESVMGPMVAIANEQAGSDGDMFSHAFKLLKLGLLVGKRTWGGVIGLAYRDSLVDGGVTTQPEFSFWFEDVAWGVENYGTDPDIEVEMRPQDYLEGRDPQLERAVQEILRTLSVNPPNLPDFGKRPKLSLPTLSPLSAT